MNGFLNDGAPQPNNRRKQANVFLNAFLFVYLGAINFFHQIRHHSSFIFLLPNISFWGEVLELPN